MKFFILFILCISANAFTFEMGFNQAWLKSNYAHQWGKDYDHKESLRILNLAKNGNSDILRMWLFEGVNSKAINWKDSRPIGVSTSFLNNLEHFIKNAKQRNIKLNFTFFDGNIINQTNFNKFKNRWWNILNNKYSLGDIFLKKIIAPTLTILNKYPGTVTQIELINEANAFLSPYSIYPVMFKNKWDGFNRFSCYWRNEIHKKVTYKIQVTSSLGWKSATKDLLSNRLNNKCFDYYDIHIYNDSGTIEKCHKIKDFIKQKKKSIQLGEFGQESKAFDDQLQNQNLISFINNAKDCGFSSALAWRLSDVRKGHNKHAKHSFEAHGKPRKAYFTFKKLNKNNF